VRSIKALWKDVRGVIDGAVQVTGSLDAASCDECRRDLQRISDEVRAVLMTHPLHDGTNLPPKRIRR
jgi:hypothetical protein